MQKTMYTTFINRVREVNLTGIKVVFETINQKLQELKKKKSSSLLKQKTNTLYNCNPVGPSSHVSLRDVIETLNLHLVLNKVLFLLYVYIYIYTQIQT